MSKHTVKQVRDTADELICRNDDPLAMVASLQLHDYAKELEARESASVPDEVALKLARACLWSAFVWNDHNFGDKRAYQFDREAAAKVGITTLEQANEWLDKQEALAADLARDAARLDYLEREIDNDGARSLFRKNLPITRAAIDAAIKEQSHE